MNKKILLLSVTVLFLTFGMTQSVMAKKIVYMGHEYNGKVNKQKIPEGEGKIQIGELSIEGIFKGNVITDASFSTTWLSYKGNVTFDESSNFTLKEGGIITFNVYTSYDFSDDFFGKDPKRIKIFRDSRVEHREKTLLEDSTTSFEDLKRYPWPMTFPVEPLPMQLSSLNPPTEKTIDVLPYMHYFGMNSVDTGLNISDSILFYPSEYDVYTRNRDILVAMTGDQIFATLDNYKDSDGGIWKKSLDGYKVTFPDGSFCSYETGYRRKYPRTIPVSLKGRSIILIDNQPFSLSIEKGGTADDIEERDKIVLKPTGNTMEFQLMNPDGWGIYDYSDKTIDGIDKIIKEKVIPYLSVPDNTELFINCWSHSRPGEYYEIVTYKNGVFKGREELAEERRKINQEQRKIDLANQKEHDKLVAYWTKRLGFNPEGRTTKQIIKVGAPFKALCDFYEGRTFVHFDLFKQDGNYKYYRILNGSVNWGWVGVVGDKVRSVSWSGNEL